MIRIKRLMLVKSFAVLLVFLFMPGDWSVYSETGIYEERFLQAKHEYTAGNYTGAIDMLERIHRIGFLKGDLGEKDKELLSRVYVLLGAAYEQQGSILEARNNYAKSRKYLEKPVVDGLNFDSLVEYQRMVLDRDLPPREIEKKIIAKGGKKGNKKFPWLLVTGIAVAAVVILYFLLKKNGGEDIDPDYDTSVLGFEWATVPAGEFLMGDNFNEGMEDERPVHTVYLDEYRISKYEVTFEQYDMFCDDTDRTKPDDRGWGRENMPVFYVSWNDAQAFCEWLSEKTGKNIHLPTEAQWEKAARGTDQRRFPWGNSAPDCNLANYSGCASQTVPVDSHPSGASPYGVMDMAGNVSEFCQDWYDGGYYSVSPENNPPGPEEGISKVQRGGSWINAPDRLRCAQRAIFDPVVEASYIGFRICWESI